MAKRQNKEKQLQSRCVKWFDENYPQYKRLYFMVNNDGWKGIGKAMADKAQGTKSGVSDTILLVPTGNYSGLCVEFKVGYNKQSEAQKEFEKAVTDQGYKYVIPRTFNEFKTEIKTYLNEPTVWDKIGQNKVKFSQP